jgi:uncharacterized protein YndB with AHSA1/START domain
VSASLDRLLVRAPVGVVYATLTDVDGWPRWWRGCRTRRDVDADSTAPEGDHHLLVLRGGGSRRSLRSLRLVARVHGWRHDLGVHVGLQDRSGAALADVEWWLEGTDAGTLVHHALRGTAGGARTRRVRRALALGMQDLKDHLELAVEIALGVVPGVVPDVVPGGRA